MAGNENEDGLGDIDLYDELITDADQAERNLSAEKLKELEDLKNESVCSREKIIQLESQIETMKRHNDILKRNISMLYKTAKLEIVRKNDLLNDLQRRRLNLPTGTCAKENLDVSVALIKERTNSDGELPTVSSKMTNTAQIICRNDKCDSSEMISKSSKKNVQIGHNNGASVAVSSQTKQVVVLPNKDKFNHNMQNNEASVTTVEIAQKNSEKEIKLNDNIDKSLTVGTGPKIGSCPTKLQHYLGTLDTSDSRRNVSDNKYLASKYESLKRKSDQVFNSKGMHKRICIVSESSIKKSEKSPSEIKIKSNRVTSSDECKKTREHNGITKRFSEMTDRQSRDKLRCDQLMNQKHLNKLSEDRRRRIRDSPSRSNHRIYNSTKCTEFYENSREASRKRRH